jgi:hypothetical protein
MRRAFTRRKVPLPLSGERVQSDSEGTESSRLRPIYWTFVLLDRKLCPATCGVMVGNSGVGLVADS